MEGPTTRLRLRVVPGGKGTDVVGRLGESWKVRVSAAPERGRANEAVVELLSRALDLPARDVEVVRGHSSRDKLVAVRGLTEDEIDSRLDASVARPARAR